MSCGYALHRHASAVSFFFITAFNSTQYEYKKSIRGKRTLSDNFCAWQSILKMAIRPIAVERFPGLIWQFSGHIYQSSSLVGGRWCICMRLANAGRISGARVLSTQSLRITIYGVPIISWRNAWPITLDNVKYRLMVEPWKQWLGYIFFWNFFNIFSLEYLDR